VSFDGTSVMLSAIAKSALASGKSYVVNITGLCSKVCYECATGFGDNLFRRSL